MILASKVELNDWPVLLPALSPQSTEGVLACHRCLPATPTSVPQLPVVAAMQMDIPEERVFECSAQVPFPAPRTQESCRLDKIFLESEFSGL